MSWLLIPLQILAGWLLADLLTGIGHWIEDRFGRSEMPILGPLVFAPNRLHHQRPLAFTRTGFLARNGTTVLFGLLAWAPVFWLAGINPWTVAGAIGTCSANQVHYWAHVAASRPRVVQKLQAIGALQSPRHHAEHHAPPHRRRYCILTDWLNPVLDTVHFWTLIEAPLPRRWFA